MPLPRQAPFSQLADAAPHSHLAWMAASHRGDVVVAGGGPSGLTAACLLAQAGLSVTCIAGRGFDPQKSDDPRTTALMQPSVRLLAYLEVWPGDLREHSAALRKLRIIDDSGRGWSEAPASFSAAELGIDAFGWNIPVAQLIPALAGRAERLGVRLIAADARCVQPDDDRIALQDDDGTLWTARLAVAADGAGSPVRRTAGIRSIDWRYDQDALTTSFSHSIPHDGLSIEFHRAGGPLTTVPLPGCRSSLVWMERPTRARELAGMPAAKFAKVLQVETHGALGIVCDVGRIGRFEMKGVTARRFAANRVILIGEAAHMVPPIGAQGLNMSLRDAAEAAELVSDAYRERRDIGDAALLRMYDAQRRRDVMPRQAIIDAMNRSLLSRNPLVHAARSFGLSALDLLPPLKRGVMQVGMGPARLPRSMQG